MFHDIGAAGPPLSFPSHVFTTGLERLLLRGWRAVTARDIGGFLTRREPFPPRFFAMTFDDAYESVYLVAWPVMKRLGVTGTVFVNPLPGNATRLEDMEGRPRLTWAQLEEMRAGGIEIGGHSLTHSDLSLMTIAQLHDELGGGKRELEKKLGPEIESIAYPFGRQNARVREVATEYYRFGFGTELAQSNVLSDVMAVPRLEMHYFRREAVFGCIGTALLEPYLALRRGPRRIRRWIT
jgi:peptidoglycan/xylan/chitin deacetylase (PgdA/CDA1 family)